MTETKNNDKLTIPTIYEKLAMIQAELKAPKNQYNSFGKYSYRSCEDILEAVKPLAHKYGCCVLVRDAVVNLEGRYYVRAEVYLIDQKTCESTDSAAWAREDDNKKGMDASQLTGSTSSYARKYALNGLFAIDDTKDADAQAPVNSSPKVSQKAYQCADCGKPFKDYTDKYGKKWTAGQVFHMAEKKNTDGKARCSSCKAKHDKENGGK